MSGECVVVSSDFNEEQIVKTYLSNYEIVTNNQFNPFSSVFSSGNIVFLIDILEEISQNIQKTMIDALNNDMNIFIVINNIDRLFELDLTVDDFQDNLIDIFIQVNKIIFSTGRKDKELDFEKGNIAWGSVKGNWLNNLPMMVETGVNFLDMMNYCKNSSQEELSKKIPFNKTFINMIETF